MMMKKLFPMYVIAASLLYSSIFRGKKGEAAGIFASCRLFLHMLVYTSQPFALALSPGTYKTKLFSP